MLSLRKYCQTTPSSKHSNFLFCFHNNIKTIISLWLRWLNRVMRDHEAHASAINRKWIFVFFLVFSKLKLLKHNKQGPIFAVQQSPLKSRLLVSKLNYSNNAIFWRLFGFDFNSIQFPLVKPSDILRQDKVWQEETFKIEKSRGCQGSLSVFSIFVFFWLSENLVLQIFLIN